jgi:hypothetical protein
MGPTSFFTDFKDAKKVFFSYFFSYNLPTGTSSAVCTSMRKGKDPEPDPDKEPDPDLDPYHLTKRIRIREAQKHADQEPVPQHWFRRSGFWIHIRIQKNHSSNKLRINVLKR